MDLKIALDTIWVMVTAMLVFFMNLGFAMVESGFCRQKNAVNILSKNFVVFAVSSLGFLFLGWGLMFGDGNGFLGTSGLLMAGGARQLAGDRRSLPGRLLGHQLDRRALLGQILLPARLRRHGGHHRLGGRGRADQVQVVHPVQFPDDHVHLPGRRPLDLGRRLGWPSWACGTSPAPRWSTRWAAGRPWRAFWCSGPGSASTPTTAASIPSPVTTCPSPPSAPWCSGSAGSDSIPDRPWRPTRWPSPTWR